MFKVGKRYTCAECGKTVMVAKPSEDGVLFCCDTEMTEQGPRALGSSD
jgi:hypothetical protein